MDVVLLISMLLEHERNLDEKINNFVVQAGEAASWPLVLKYT